jgi:hypothetical protein
MKRLMIGWLVMFFALAPVQVARADQITFDDPAQSGTHPSMLAFTSVSATQTSIAFTSQNNRYADLYLKVTACVACNVTMQVWSKDITALGNDVMFCNDPVAITAVGTYHYTIGPGTDAVNATPGFVAPIGIRLNCNRTLPPQFYAVMVWNSGTTITGSVRGSAWQ